MFSSSLQCMAMTKVCLQLPPWQRWNNTMYIKHSDKRRVAPSWVLHPKMGIPIPANTTVGPMSDSEMLGKFGKFQIHKLPRSQVSWTNWQLPLGGESWAEGHKSTDMLRCVIKALMAAGFLNKKCTLHTRKHIKCGCHKQTHKAIQSTLPSASPINVTGWRHNGQRKWRVLLADTAASAQSKCLKGTSLKI